MTIPNQLTCVRLALLPLLYVTFYLKGVLPYNYAFCTLIVTLIGITDFLDGYLARKLNQLSRFGAFIDPVADKLAVGMSCILLTQLYPYPWMVFAIIIIIGREMAISALREWMAGQNLGKITAVSQWGKYKTFMQMWSIGGLFLAADIQWMPLTYFVYFCLAIATALTLFSMVDYFIKAAQQMKK